MLRPLFLSDKRIDFEVAGKKQAQKRCFQVLLFTWFHLENEDTFKPIYLNVRKMIMQIKYTASNNVLIKTCASEIEDLKFLKVNPFD